MSFAANIPIGDFRGENRGVESTVSLLVTVKYCTLVDLNCFKTQFISKQFHTATVGLMISISFIGPTYLFWSNLLQTPTKIRVWQFVMYSPHTHTHKEWKARPLNKANEWSHSQKWHEHTALSELNDNCQDNCRLFLLWQMIYNKS